MKLLITALIVLAFITLQVLIGGTRLIFGLPGAELIGLAAILSAWWGLKTSRGFSIPAVVATVAFIGYILVRNRLSPIDYIARMQFFIAATSLLLYLIVTLVADQPKDRLRVIYIWLLLAIIQTLVGGVQFKEGNQWMPVSWLQRGDDWWRASGLFISPNHFAGFLEITALMAFSLVVWGRVPVIGKVLIGYVGLCCVAGVAISGSRGGYLSLAIGTFVFFILSLLVFGRLRPERLLLVGIIALVALGASVATTVTVMLKSDYVRDRMQTVADTENIRFMLWDSALQQFELSPVTGTGGFTFLYYGRLFRNPAVQNDPIHVHNDYLQLLADYGLIGAGLFLVFFAIHAVTGVRGLLRLVNRSGNIGEMQDDELAICIGALSGLAAMTMHSVVDFNMHIFANALQMSVIIGVLACPIAPERTAKGIGILRKAIGGILRVLLPIGGAAILVYGAKLIPGEWYAEKARVAVRDKAFDEGLKYAEAGIAKEKSNPDLYFYAGEAAQALAFNSKKTDSPYWKQSIENYEQALEIFPYDSRTAFRLASALATAGRYTDAVDVLDRAEDMDPSSSLLPAYRGLVEFLTGDYEGAMDHFAESIELDPRQDFNTIAYWGYKEAEAIVQQAQQTLPTPRLTPAEVEKLLEEDEPETSAPQAAPTQSR